MLRAADTGNDAVGRFDELYRECRTELVRYAERRNARDAELVADLALLDVYRALDRLRSNHPRVIWAYLYRSADNHMRREASKFSPELRDDLESVGGSQTFEDDVVGAFSLDEMLALLSSNQEKALRPKLEENLSAEEIGVELGKSAAAVRQLQHQGIRRLRRLLYVAVTVILVVLAAVLSDREVSVNQSPAYSQIEQPAPETTVPVPTTSPDGPLLIPADPDPTARSSTATGRAASDSDDVDDNSGEDGDGAEVGVGVVSQDPPEPSSVVPTTDIADPPVSAMQARPAYALVNVGTGECLDQPWSQDDGARIVQWRCAGHTALNQMLQETPGNGGFMLAFSHSGKCLDAADGLVFQWTCHGGENQLFTWNGSQLQSKMTGHCLTVADDAQVAPPGPVESGGLLRTAPCVNSPAQQFQVERYGAPDPGT